MSCATNFIDGMLEIMYEDIRNDYHTWLTNMQYWVSVGDLSHAYFISKRFETQIIKVRWQFREFFDCFYWSDTSIPEQTEQYLTKTKFMEIVNDCIVSDLVCRGYDNH